MRIASKTDTGRVRKTNQDCYAAAELSGGVAWAVVCDGMGGANGGNIASGNAVRVISEQISTAYRQGMGSGSIKNMLESAVFAANAHIYDMSKSVDSLAGMGTTVVAVVLSDGKAHLVHAGDSRAYLVKKTGDEYTLTQITKDHSVVEKMIEEGEITKEQAKDDPLRNVITRALGVDFSVEIDYNEVLLEQDCSILICTDGLTNYVDTDEILDTLSENNFYECPEKLIEKANAAGGGDNITVLLIAE